MKRGFTIVEISIVFVVIGLLVGGILATQSIIASARIQSYIKTIQYYDIAMNNFKNAYEYSPGDSAQFDPAGDENGIIDQYYSGWTCHGAYHSYEGFAFFGHLSQAGMTNQTFTPFSPAMCGGSDTAPYKAGLNAPYFGKEKYAYTYAPAVKMGYVSDNPTEPFASTVKMYDAIALDKKLDDGVETTGKVNWNTITGRSGSNPNPNSAFYWHPDEN